MSAGANNNIYNALGEMFEKLGNGGMTLLVYDEAGHILGEYSSPAPVSMKQFGCIPSPQSLDYDGPAGREYPKSFIGKLK